MTSRVARALEFILEEPSSTVFASDFDGTLAPISEDPTTASPEDGVAESLVTLATALQRVAIVSGRPAAFLRDRLGEDVARECALFGRYGAEQLQSDGSILTRDAGSALGDVVQRLRIACAEIDPRVLVEDKSGSVALHWRGAPYAEDAVRTLAARAALEAGLEVREGKMIVDLVRAGAPTKGSTISALLNETSTACCFVGDDVGDLDGFDALDRFESRGGHALRVAVASSELPKELADRADLIVPGPSATAAMLEKIATALKGA